MFIAIVCFLLSLLLFFIFDTPSSTMNLTDINKEITVQEIEKLKGGELTAGDLEKLRRDYDKERKK